MPLSDIEQTIYGYCRDIIASRTKQPRCRLMVHYDLPLLHPQPMFYWLREDRTSRRAREANGGIYLGVHYAPVFGIGVSGSTVVIKRANDLITHFPLCSARGEKAVESALNKWYSEITRFRESYVNSEALTIDMNAPHSLFALEQHLQIILSGMRDGLRKGKWAGETKRGSIYLKGIEFVTVEWVLRLAKLEQNGFTYV